MAREGYRAVWKERTAKPGGAAAGGPEFTARILVEAARAWPCRLACADRRAQHARKPRRRSELSRHAGVARFAPRDGLVWPPNYRRESDAHPLAYVWSATRIESVIRLRGSVPSEEDRRTVLGMVKAHFPDLEVEDRLKIVAGAPPKEQWLGAVSFGLKQLAHLKRGSARLLNVGLKVDGEARSAADYAEVKKALSGPLPTGLAILDDEYQAADGRSLRVRRRSLRQCADAVG